MIISLRDLTLSSHHLLGVKLYQRVLFEDVLELLVAELSYLLHDFKDRDVFVELERVLGLLVGLDLSLIFNDPETISTSNLLESNGGLGQIEGLDDAFWGGFRLRNLCAGLLANLEHLVNLLYCASSLFVALLDFLHSFLNNLAVFGDYLELLELVIGLGLTNSDVIIDYCLHYSNQVKKINSYLEFLAS